MTSFRLSTPYHLLRATRPHQWTKNLLLFAGVLFSHHYTDPLLLWRATLGFMLFCLLSGAIYLLNDIQDIESDRLHPKKRLRPFASGSIPVWMGWCLSIALLILGLAGSFAISLPFGLFAASYVVITSAYSFFFKHVVIMDVILLALGFVIRAVAGVLVIRGIGPHVPLTPWFIICVLFLSLFIAICKRRHELLHISGAAEHRRVLGEYTPAFLDQMIAVSTSASIFSYALYLITVYGGQDGQQNVIMIATLPFVIYGIFRYLYLVFRCSEGGEPEMLVLQDRPLLLNTLVWLFLLLTLQRWTQTGV